jgi:glycosyltransferase involved in cell wall biosynthesis
MTYRVLHVLPDFGVGGAERMAVHLMRHTADTIFEVRALSLFSPRKTVLEFELASHAIMVDYLGKQRGPDLSMIHKIDRILQAYRPHVVHTHRYALAYALPAMLLRRIPVMVHTVHSMAEREVGRFGRVIHGFGFRHGVVPVSIANQVTESIVRVYGRKSVPCIPNGIPVAEYRKPAISRDMWRDSERIPRDAFLYACVARLSLPKNHEMLVEAFAKGPGSQPNVYLLLVGDGDQRAALEGYVDQLGLRGRVRFLGQRTDVVSVLQGVDVFVLASAWEGNPLSVMEAMSAGKAVVCTAVGGVPELVRDGVTGLLVPHGDGPTFSKAMTRLLEDNALRSTLGTNAAAMAQSFDVESMTSGYEALYLDLLKANTAGGI